MSSKFPNDQLSLLGPAESDPRPAKKAPPKSSKKPEEKVPLRAPDLNPVFKQERQASDASKKAAALEFARQPNLKPASIEKSTSEAVENLKKKVSTGAIEAVESLNRAPVAETAAEDNVSAETESSETQVLSVSELNQAIRQLMEGEFPLVWLKGEISNFKSHSSGHFYFSLKDQKSQINAVMFKGFNARLGFKPQDGMEVIVRGKVTVYEPRGSYQIFCEVMEPMGLGALQMAYEQLKQKLEKEGLFDPRRKRPLPAFPTRVAIVTSPTGAAIRDMLNVLGRRFKGLEITLIPASVQGSQAPGEIIAAIELANKIGGFDVMIVGRGGGSIEDLWSFNDENVCRAIAASKIPTVSAVGHEIDFTIADFVADLRAPTPSAAAELIVKNAADLCQQLALHEKRLVHLMAQRFQYLKKNLEYLSNRVVDPQRRIQDCILRCDELIQRLEASVLQQIHNKRMNMALHREKLGDPFQFISNTRQRLSFSLAQLAAVTENQLGNKQSHFSYLAGKLDSLSPLKVVERGYAMVTTLNESKIVNDHRQIKKGDELRLKFARGEAIATVQTVREDGVEGKMNELGIKEVGVDEKSST